MYALQKRNHKILRKLLIQFHWYTQRLGINEHVLLDLDVLEEVLRYTQITNYNLVDAFEISRFKKKGKWYGTFMYKQLYKTKPIT